MRHIITTSIALSTILLLLSCHPKNKDQKPLLGNLPAVIMLDSLQQTQFVVTLENPIDTTKNSIYAPAFLYVWDVIKKQLGSAVISDSSSSPAFRFLNQSTSYLNSLKSDEYTTEVAIVDGAITARAFFNKTLPFETKFDTILNGINFTGKPVAAFGMPYHDLSLLKSVQILYYNNDDEFVLKLIPKDTAHEIILAKGVNNYQTLKDATSLVNNLIAKGKKEQQHSNSGSKYSFMDKDMFAVPVIQFNIETHYKDLEGQRFVTGDKKNHIVGEAYQRTGFILNEAGAVAESETFATVDSITAEPVPKKMIFNKPFLVIIKRADQPNPYFVMRVANTELLTRK